VNEMTREQVAQAGFDPNSVIGVWGPRTKIYYLAHDRPSFFNFTDILESWGR
jgi:hypothetical protein